MNGAMITERWEKILDLVDRHGTVTVEEVSRELGVSMATVRRDLARVHQKGLIERTRGGAAAAPKVRMYHTLAESRRIHPEEKERVGRAAAGLVNAGETLMIDGGFTTYQVARHIAAGRVTVVSNSFDVAQALVGRDDVTLLFIGGTLNLVTGTTVGPNTHEQILALWADKAILGADAVSPTQGLSSPHPDAAQTKRSMIRRSGRLIVVADHSKLGGSMLYHVAPVQAIATLVTDDGAEPAVLEAFRAAGVEVRVAGTGGGG